MIKKVIASLVLLGATQAHASDTLCVSIAELAYNTAEARDHGASFGDIMSVIYEDRSQPMHVRVIVTRVVDRSYHADMTPAATSSYMYDWCMLTVGD